MEPKSDLSSSSSSSSSFSSSASKPQSIMADLRHHHHHHQHQPHRVSVSTGATNATPFATSPRHYLMYPYTPRSPSSTPSKSRYSSFPSLNSKTSGRSFLSLFLLILFYLRSLYSLLPLFRSSPSFSLFPFSLLYSLLSFILTLSISLFSSYSSSSSSKDPFHQNKQNQPIFALTFLTHSQQRLLVVKSMLLALVFLFRFQALRYCGTAVMILTELTGSVASRFIAKGRIQNRNRSPKFLGFVALCSGLFLLAFSWNRVECLPFSADKWGYAVSTMENCARIWPMLLPFLSGFLGRYERISMDWGTINQLGHKRVRLVTLFFTTVVLFVPAIISFLIYGLEASVSIRNSFWPLVNTVVFGVLLNENSGNEKLVSSKDYEREFLVTFACTLVLELCYSPELSFWGLLLSGLLLYIAVRELDPFHLNYLESGEEYSMLSFNMTLKPVQHILSERKSRKIALFLLINAGYMVVEFIAGFMSNSLGLISDACHMLFDCAALAIGLYASYISRLPANRQYNYGRGRFEVLSGYANAVFLVLVGALIVLESLERILDPEDISTDGLLIVSIGGFMVNVIGLIFFHEEHHHVHGGSGPCSHSHSHSNSHHHHHRNLHCLGKHDQKGHRLEKSSSSHCGHHHHHCSHDEKADCHAEDNTHAQQHVNRDHGDHHDHCDQHDFAYHHHTDHPYNVTSLAHPFEVFNVASLHGKVVCSSLNNCDSLQKKELSASKEPQEHSYHHIDHNMEGIFLHVLADTLGSVGVVISTLLIKYKGWLVADPACSVFISVMIISSVIPLLGNSAEILLQRVPRAHEQELKDVLKNVLKIKGVYGIQKHHVWSFTNTDVVGTLHLHVSTDADHTTTKSQVSHIFHSAGVKDLTLQVESVG